MVHSFSQKQTPRANEKRKRGFFEFSIDYNLERNFRPAQMAANKAISSLSSNILNSSKLHAFAAKQQNFLRLASKEIGDLFSRCN